MVRLYIHGEEKVDANESGMTLAIGNSGIYREGFGVRPTGPIFVGDKGPEPLTTLERC